LPRSTEPTPTISPEPKLKVVIPDLVRAPRSLAIVPNAGARKVSEIHSGTDETCGAMQINLAHSADRRGSSLGTAAGFVEVPE
jgi:hypothetical protein